MCGWGCCLGLHWGLESERPEVSFSLASGSICFWVHCECVSRSHFLCPRQILVRDKLAYLDILHGMIHRGKVHLIKSLGQGPFSQSHSGKNNLCHLCLCRKQVERAEHGTSSSGSFPATLLPKQHLSRGSKWIRREDLGGLKPTSKVRGREVWLVP